MIMARVTSDTNRLGQVAWGTVDTVWGLTIMLLVAVIRFSERSTVLSCAALMVKRVFSKRILMAYRKVENQLENHGGPARNNGRKDIKSLIRKKEHRRIQGTDGFNVQSSVKAAVFSAVYMPIVLLLGSIGASLVLWHGGNRVAFGTVSYGTLVAFVNYAIRFFEPVRELARIFAELQFAQASGERVLSLIDTEPDITEGDRITDIYGDFFSEERQLAADKRAHSL